MTNFQVLVLSVFLLQCLSSGYCADVTTAKSMADPKNPPTDSVSIAPVADCAGNAVDFGTLVRACFVRCAGPPEPEEASKVDIFHMFGEGPRVVECVRIEFSQEFTQTWTFSTIAGSMKSKPVYISEAECISAIEKNCVNYDCNMREPDTLTPEYHYGSVTTVRSTMIMLMSSPSTLYVENDIFHVSPTGSELRFDMSKEIGRSKESIYVWKKITAPDTCPFKAVGVYGCDRYKDNDEDFYSCSGGRIAITPRKGNKDILKACVGVKLSEEGFIYNMTKGTQKEASSGRLAIDARPGTVEAEDTSYLRHKIQQVASKLDSDICLNKCEIMSLEARSSNKTHHLVRAGMDNFLIMPNGTAKYCKPNHGCKLPEKPTFCGNPPRVSIICNNHARYWNPLKPYTEPDEPCYKPDELESLSFSLGTTHYDVNKGLRIKVPQSAYHNSYSNEFLRYHNSHLQMSVKGLDDLKSGWRESQSTGGGLGIITNAQSEIKSPHISIGDSIVKTFGSVFSSVKSLEAIVGIIFVLVIVGASLALLERLTGLYSRLRGPYKNVPTTGIEARDASEGGAKWI
ncbi:MAG: glycoprotein [Pastinaca cytorhabdovirus 1]|uniref:Glycoprotein n=1 Tax=Pastinaca cytorhabdovirus 1 TaxID=2950847 RepID=A0AAE9MQY1_9RHAB|nr:MAG: glycoprotein [Pastinaca cytorhabdovirus 1]